MELGCHTAGRAVESSRVPAHPRLPCSCAQMPDDSHESWTSLWDSPDAPLRPSGSALKRFSNRDLWFYGAGGEEQGKLPPATDCPAPAAVGTKPAPLGCGETGGLVCLLLPSGPGRRRRGWHSCPRAATPNPAAPSTGGGSARPATSAAPPAPPPWERGMRGMQERGMRGMRERGMRERRSPAFPAGEPSSVLLLFPAIHHRLPLSLGHRGCHPAVTEVEKNEPFKRGRARDAREHETN